MSCISARRPDHDHHSPVKMAHCEHPQFAIVPAGVGEIQRIAAEDLCGILKIKPTRCKQSSRV